MTTLSGIEAAKKALALNLVWELQKFCNDSDQYLGEEVNKAICGVWDAITSIEVDK
jgi:hypothetical protein